MGMSRVKASTIPIVILVTLSLMTTSVNAFSAVVVSTARQRPCSTFGSTTGSTASIMADRYSSQHFTTTTRYSATKQDTDKDYHRKRRLAKQLASIPKQAAKIYTDYAQRLWLETNTDARSLIAQDRATSSIRTVEHMMRREEYLDLAEDGHIEEARQQLVQSCQQMLQLLDQQRKKSLVLTSANVTDTELVSLSDETNVKPAGKQTSRSVLFGAAMGAVVACWVFSGNWIFTGVFTLMTILGQLEYYRMVMNTGIYPARRISIVGASSMFLTVGTRTSIRCASCCRQETLVFLTLTLSLRFIMLH